MIEDKSLPQTADELADLLNESFPETSGELGWQHDRFVFQAGARSVVRFVNELRKRRDDNLLETTDVLRLLRTNGANTSSPAGSAPAAS